MILVSVIIPFYNAEKYITQSIESVLNQTHPDWELILINDGSTDNSKNIVKQYLNEAKLKYFEQINKGQASARNLGVKNASGELIAFLDADDIWMPNKLETQIPLLTDSVDLVFSNAQIIDQEGKPTGDYLNPGCGFFCGFGAFDYLIKGQYFVPTLTVICRKSKIYEVGFFDENDAIRNAEDFDLWSRMLLNGVQFYGTYASTAYYRIHPDQSSREDLANNIAVTESLLKLRDANPKYLYPINSAINSRLLRYYSNVADCRAKLEPQITRLYPAYGQVHMWAVNIFGFKTYFRLMGFFFYKLEQLLFRLKP